MTRSERLLLIAVAFVAVLFVLFGGVALFMGDEERSPYDPTYYGIPDRIAGYETLAVLHAGNDRCMAKGVMQVITRQLEPEIPAQPDELQRFLDDLQMPNIEWHIRTVDSTVNIRQLMREAETRFQNAGEDCPAPD